MIQCQWRETFLTWHILLVVQCWFLVNFNFVSHRGKVTAHDFCVYKRCFRFRRHDVSFGCKKKDLQYDDNVTSNVNSMEHVFVVLLLEGRMELLDTLFVKICWKSNNKRIHIRIVTFLWQETCLPWKLWVVCCCCFCRWWWKTKEIYASSWMSQHFPLFLYIICHINCWWWYIMSSF